MEVNNQEWKNERIFPSSRLNSLTVVAQQRRDTSARLCSRANWGTTLEAQWTGHQKRDSMKFPFVHDLMPWWSISPSSSHPSCNFTANDENARACYYFWRCWWGSEKARPSWTCVIMYHKVSQRHWAVNFIAMPVSRVWSNGFNVVTIFRRWKCLKPTLLVERQRVCRRKTHSPCSSRMWSKIIEQKKKSFVVRRVFYLATLPSMFNFSQSNLQNFRSRLFCFELSSMLFFLKSF